MYISSSKLRPSLIDVLCSLRLTGLGLRLRLMVGHRRTLGVPEGVASSSTTSRFVWMPHRCGNGAFDETSSAGWAAHGVHKNSETELERVCTFVHDY